MPQRKKSFVREKSFLLQFLRAYKVALVHFVLLEEGKKSGKKFTKRLKAIAVLESGAKGLN